MGLIRSSSIFGLPVSIGTYQDFLEEIRVRSSSHTSDYVCVANVHMFMEGQKDDTLRKSIREAGIVTPDGVPLCWALRWVRGVKQERVAGMDLLPDLFRMANIWNRSFFIYGGTDAMLSKSVAYLESNYPGIQLKGTYSPPFRSLTPAENEQIVQQINASKADIVLVVLGCPKQEKWMWSMKGRINALMIGIGGAMPVLIGDRKRAPRWIQRSGLEWFYRLVQEPRRLFYRYFTTNIAYIYNLIKELVLLRFRRRYPHLK